MAARGDVVDPENVERNDGARRALETAETLYRTGKSHELVQFIGGLPAGGDLELQVRLQVLSGMAHFDLGQATRAISDLRRASETSLQAGLQTQFSTAFAHFIKESDFLEPNALIPLLTRLRQLASSVGDSESLASLHLAVARVEGFRGHYLTARHHLELARSLAGKSRNVSLLCSLDLIDASLETLGGNLTRARTLAERGLSLALGAGFFKFRLAALTNLAAIAISRDQLDQAAPLLDEVLQAADALTYVRVGALDTLAQLKLRAGQLPECEDALRQCQLAIARDSLPARSWNDLAHQVTRCAYLETVGDWQAVIDIAEECDGELRKRQFKAVHTLMMCAQARALARLGREADANSALATAVRTCPRGAVEALVVLEASKGVCAALRGSTTTAAVHFDRAVAGCRAIGHRSYEAWIDRQRGELERTGSRNRASQQPALDVSTASMMLSDVAAALGAGHSIDLLTHRIAEILRAAISPARISVETESGRDYRSHLSAEVTFALDGDCTIRLAGSDRVTAIAIRGAESVEEISLIKGVTDLVQMAVARTSDADREEDDVTLWPRSMTGAGSDSVFRSPRMVELLRIAERLATTSLPVLLTGETGTGKEVFARLIHDHSAQKRGPFVPFNCSAISRELVESQLFGHRRGAFTGALDAFPGVIRSAERGTLFLDEIGDLDGAVQPKLLRFLESGEVQTVGESRPHKVAVRIVAATNSSLEALAREGRFRRDLLYRIGVAQIELPPLRDRKDEIPALAELFLNRYAAECGRRGLRLADELIAALLLYNWPGNIRQLSNEIRRITALAEDGAVLTASDLAPEILANWKFRAAAADTPAVPLIEVRLEQPLARAVDELERKFIEHALAISGGRVADAAQLLGVSRKGLFLKRRRVGMVRGDS
jgi:DNA-binding NtrC family response regulator